MSDPWSTGAPGVLETPVTDADVVIIGTGAGGAAAAWSLRDSGRRVLLVEQGDFLPREAQNWDPREVFVKSRYKNVGRWRDASTGAMFKPGVHDYVGGNTKVFGAAFPRFRESDFGAVEHVDGTSPAWPIDYAELEPWYCRAEQMYGVHGVEDDPTAPWRSQPYPYPAIPHEPGIQRLVDTLYAQGYRPSSVPIGIDLRDGGRCIRCRTCDGYPCAVDAKSDADLKGVRPAIEGDVRLMTRTAATRVVTNDAGTAVTGVELEREGHRWTVTAPVVVVACGSVRSATLLMRSANAAHPGGLGNGHDQLGRHYMQHVNTGLISIDPRRRNDGFFQKTFQVNDFYFAGRDGGFPWGNLQALGKLQTQQLVSSRPKLPEPMLAYIAAHSVEWWVMSEDLPLSEHRIRLGADGVPEVTWRPTNTSTHQKLIKAASEMMRSAGFPVSVHETFTITTNSHQCGTLRMGDDPAMSVTDRDSQVHGIAGLIVGDSSVFVSSAAVNPALTISALAMRAMHKAGLIEAAPAAAGPERTGEDR